MVGFRPVRLCLAGFFLAASLSAQQQPAPQPPKPPSPFETIPQAPEAPKPEVPKPLVPPPAPAAATTPQPAAAPGNPTDLIDEIQFRGARLVPQDMLKSLIYTKQGDVFSTEALNRDLIVLWNTGRFDDITVERERSLNANPGWIVRFVLVERPRIRSFKFDGLKSITESEVLDRWKERHATLVADSQYDRNKVQRAKTVLQDYLAERGRQFATVDTEIHQLPPSALEIDFKVDEGPKVKVGNIDIEGNTVFSHRILLRSMKQLHPIGIPYSIFAESLFPRTFDSAALDDDQQRLVQFYQKNGYFTAHVVSSSSEIVDVGGARFRIPLFRAGRAGKNANISIGIEEGKLYHLGTINFVGMKQFRAPDQLVKPLFNMGSGDVFSTEKLQKGYEALRKLYGSFGYINFVANMDPEVVPGTDKVNLTVDVEEGSKFYIRRIDFSGNTTTRDKVIRRELMLDEGDVYSQNLWELSLLRLNQLGYFETLKENESVTMTTDTRTSTVDLTLKVKERGKNTIQLSGGISGISGSFVGFSYSTNNFLGLGETLSLSSQVGTRTTDVSLGFTEPYFLDRPIQLGFTIFDSRFNYDQGREASVLAGANLIPLYNSLGSQNLLNYVSNSYGFTAFASHLLRRSFARVGISYGYSIQSVRTLTDAATQYYNYLDFQNINGQSANNLGGIRTSSVTPTFSYNSVNHPLTPSGGTGLQASVLFSGSVLGGNVNEIEPQIDYRHFMKGFKKNHVIGFHLLGRYVTGYGGKVAPPFNRFFMGGENDVRGFELYGVSPIVYVPNSGVVNQLNADGSPMTQRTTDPITGAFVRSPVTATIPTYQLVFPGGDTNLVGNFEYRIPIVGPVTLALFFDAGMNRISNQSQLKLNPERITALNAQFSEAPFGDRAVVAPGTQLIRTSTGVELQILMPVFNQPFRVYWAYNPTRVDQILQPPIVADRSNFPNSTSFLNSILTFGSPTPFAEKRSTFRFTIGRTF